MATFDPISAGSLEEVNILWDSSLAGTITDPVAGTITVQTAFPISSGNINSPAHPGSGATGYQTSSWLANETTKGFISQCMVGPGGGTVTLNAGVKYDVWGKLGNGVEKFAGVLTVY